LKAVERDATAEITARVQAAAAARTALHLCGSGSKAFYGRPVCGEPLMLKDHAGVVDYDPQELVITARAGTPLAHVEARLAECGQHLPFEPPHFGPGATLGGMIASGLSGPARASAGPVRDFVLGVRILTGAGQVLNFGGRVMKNVAGYDVTRLMVGALGTLGVVLEVSLKVLPQAPGQLTLTFALSAAQALERMHDWARTPLPVSATCWVDGRLYVRLQGSTAALAHARRIGGEELNAAEAFWTSIKEHTHPFFHQAGNLWRLNVPSASAVSAAPGRTLIEWAGAQRWVVSDDARADLNEQSVQSGGFATRFRAAEPSGGEVFAALPAALLRIHRELKRTFDPYAILNPGRLYADL
jgi:glycolate oxidase FAD binding subunit